MNAPAQSNSDRLLRLLLLLGFAGTIVTLLVLSMLDFELKMPSSPDGIRSLALAEDRETAEEILQKWSEKEIIIVGLNEPKPGDPIDEDELFSRLEIASKSAHWRLAVAIFVPLTIGLACWLAAGRFRLHKFLRFVGFAAAAVQLVAICLGIAFNASLSKAIGGIDARQLLSPAFYSAQWWIAVAGVIFLLVAIFYHRIQIHREDPGDRAFRNLFSMLFFQRVPLIFIGLFLLLAWMGANGSLTIQNSMITENFWQTVILSGQAVITSAICFFFLWSIRFLAQQRLAVKAAAEVSENGDGGRNILQRATIVLFLALPMLVVTIFRNEINTPDRLSQIGVGVLAATIGSVVAMFLLFFLRFQFANLIFRLFSGSRFVAWLEKIFDQGEEEGSDAAARKIHGIHATAFATVVLIVIIYIVGYFVFSPTNESAEIRNLLPAMGYVLGLIAVLVAVFSGLTLFLDRFRFPVLLATILLSWINYQIKDSDHYFLIDQEAKDESGAPLEHPANFKDATLARLDGNGGHVTLVCCEGGGIQAAAWTGQVLQGLSTIDPDDPDFAPQFSKSIHLISSTSGGSVGALHYLESFDPETGIPDPDRLSRVASAAADPSLQEALWGLIYPDLFRPLLPVRLYSPEVDRGWAIERAFIRTTELVRGDNAGDSNISDWMRRAQSGKMPGVCFNTTSLTEGRQMAIATLDYPVSYAHPSGQGQPYASAIAYRTFDHLYHPAGQKSAPDMSKVTAARMSATFPYVTPSARGRYTSDSEEEPPAFYIADGGYFDNLGTVAAVEWIRSAMVDTEIRTRIESITILMIIAFPGDQAAEDGILPPIKNMTPPETGSPWLNAFLGPIVGMMNIRNSLQQAHGHLEIGEIQQQYEGLINVVVVQPNGFPTGYDPPLSWQLSERDKAYIRYSWSTERAQAVRELKAAGGGL